MTDAHELQRLAFGAGKKAVELPVVGDTVATSPELGRERLERHTANVPLDRAIANDARGLRREMEVLALFVERVRRRRFEEKPRVDASEQVGIRHRSGLEAHVHHPYDREVLPALRARRADRDR